jgi:hypothetical protein
VIGPSSAVGSIAIVEIRDVLALVGRKASGFGDAKEDRIRPEVREVSRSSR